MHRIVSGLVARTPFSRSPIVRSATPDFAASSLIVHIFDVLSARSRAPSTIHFVPATRAF
jgi:hypothetical protein